MARIDEGFDVWWMRIQRHKKRGAAKRYVYTYRTRPLASVKAKSRRKRREGPRKQSVVILIHQLDPVLRG